MRKFLIYTEEGYCTTPLNKEVENYQILSFYGVDFNLYENDIKVENISEEDTHKIVLDLFYEDEDNKWLFEMGYKKEYMRIKELK